MFNFESGKQIAVIKKKNDKENKKEKDKKVFMNNEDDNIKNSYKSLETPPAEYFQLVKDPEAERICLYIVGASGSGKSYWTTEFVKEWKKTNKRKKYI